MNEELKAERIEKLKAGPDVNQMEKIKSENRKAGKKYILILIVYGIGGFFAGIGSMYVAKELPRLQESFNAFMGSNGFWVELAVSALVMALVAAAAIGVGGVISRGRRTVAGLLKKEDADGLERLESRLAYGMWITSGLFILEYLYFAVVIFGAVKYLNKTGRLMVIVIGITVLFIGLFAALLLQQKLVDLIRTINPEKKGSVYDVKFRKKWEESCDEAELLIVYKAAYKVFCVLNMLCIILWVVFIILGIMTGIGFLPTLTVIIVWTTLQCVYNYYAIKLSHRKQ